MELIIKLPPWVYESVKNGTFDAKRSPYDLESVLKYGYPLPAKHGRLIDADELKERSWRYRLDSRKLIVEMIENMNTVIPAEQEESE